MIWIIIIFLSLISGFISAWAGAHGTEKAWRRYGVPLIGAAFGIIVLKSWWVICSMARVGALSLGYGIPDATDSGSDLARFWYNITKIRVAVVILTRGSIGIIKALSVIVVPILTGAWVLWFYLIPLLVLNNILWGAIVPREGMFKVFGKKLLWEEFYIEGIDSFLIMGLIALCK